MDGASLVSVLSTGEFACGHLKSEGNSYVYEGHARCRECHRQKRKVLRPAGEGLSAAANDEQVLAAARKRSAQRRRAKLSMPSIGRNARIRELLEDGPMTMQELAAALEEPVTVVRPVMSQLTGRIGGVVALPNTYPPQYALFRDRKPAARPSGSGVITPPPYRIGYANWGRGR